jgi:hypothetical protein
MVVTRVSLRHLVGRVWGDVSMVWQADENGVRTWVYAAIWRLACGAVVPPFVRCSLVVCLARCVDEHGVPVFVVIITS